MALCLLLSSSITYTVAHAHTHTSTIRHRCETNTTTHRAESTRAQRPPKATEYLKKRMQNALWKCDTNIRRTNKLDKTRHHETQFWAILVSRAYSLALALSLAHTHSHNIVRRQFTTCLNAIHSFLCAVCLRQTMRYLIHCTLAHTPKRSCLDLSTVNRSIAAAFMQFIRYRASFRRL